VTPFIIYRGTATFSDRSLQGPLRHLVVIAAAKAAD
jgi:hypothetical protein